MPRKPDSGKHVTDDEEDQSPDKDQNEDDE